MYNTYPMHHTMQTVVMAYKHDAISTQFSPTIPIHRFL